MSLDPLTIALAIGAGVIIALLCIGSHWLGYEAGKWDDYRLGVLDSVGERTPFPRVAAKRKEGK
jgi:amino acid permease